MKDEKPCLGFEDDGPALLLFVEDEGDGSGGDIRERLVECLGIGLFVMVVVVVRSVVVVLGGGGFCVETGRIKSSSSSKSGSGGFGVAT